MDSQSDRVRFVVDTVLRFPPAIVIPLVLASLLCLHAAVVKVIKGRIVQTFKQSISLSQSGSIRQRSTFIFVFIINLSVPSHPLTLDKLFMKNLSNVFGLLNKVSHTTVAINV